MKLDKIEIVMEGGPCGPELQAVVMKDGPFYYADEADKRIAELEQQVASLEGELDVANKESEKYLRRVTEIESGGGE